MGDPWTDSIVHVILMSIYLSDRWSNHSRTALGRQTTIGQPLEGCPSDSVSNAVVPLSGVQKTAALLTAFGCVAADGRLSMGLSVGQHEVQMTVRHLLWVFVQLTAHDLRVV